MNTDLEKAGLECIVTMCSFGEDPLMYKFWTTISLSLDLFVVSATVFVLMSLSRKSLQFGLAMAANFTICVILKHLIGWERLYTDCGGSDPSMPSGHTQGAVFVATYFTILWKNDRFRYYRVPVLVIWSILVGIARIKLGYHRLTEVTVGLILGLMIGIGSHRVWNNHINLSKYFKHTKPNYNDYEPSMV